VLLLVLPLALLACDTGVGDDGPPDASPSCLEAVAHSDLEWLQDEVFSKSCAAFTSCHKGAAASAARLNLEAGNTLANTVNVPAKSEPAAQMGWQIIVPGDPAASYLMVLIDHESAGGRFAGPLPEAGPMPFNNPLVCLEKRQAVERWISQLPP
jgi:hypothetical protein